MNVPYSLLKTSIFSDSYFVPLQKASCERLRQADNYNHAYILRLHIIKRQRNFRMEFINGQIKVDLVQKINPALESLGLSGKLYKSISTFNYQITI